MTITQEDALYDFLENCTEPFTVEEVVAYIRKYHNQKTGRLAVEIGSLINSRNIAFRLDSNKWLTRRGYFESVPFVITPTKMELVNGILIPGHRCIPFVNPVLLPHNYLFFWQDTQVSYTAMEGSPEEFYPYYSIFGEEYAPQYVAKDNPENEAAFNGDPYADPPEVSIQTLDMRNMYRESGFVPGDRLVVTAIDWKDGIFTIERVGKAEWSPEELQEWLDAAEQGFQSSFKLLGPGNSTEEQIAFAYWYGGTKMCRVPAYSLEDFLYEKTDAIETAAYGIETRFWYAGREIPDRRELEKNQIIPDRTMVEDILFKKEIPVSEYVVNAYVRDALFRNDPNISHLIERIVPPTIGMSEQEWGFMAAYIMEVFKELQDTYIFFSDQRMGPIRQRVGELHTQVVDFIAQLQKGDFDSSCLPKHTFIILSQIQSHAANVLEDLDIDEPLPKGELETLDSSVDSMIETYEDMQELINETLDSFRRNNLSVLKPLSETSLQGRILQISIGGTDVWRRIVISETYRLEDLHRIIQAVFGWKGTDRFCFVSDISMPNNKTKTKQEGVISKFINKSKGFVKSDKELGLQLQIADLGLQGIIEASYEYGTKWTIRLILLARLDIDHRVPLHCIAGEGAAPPETIDGPLRFRKYITFLEQGTLAERQQALLELGERFDADVFDIDDCNRNLKAFYTKETN
jgi:hypothetical protein